MVLCYSVYSVYTFYSSEKILFCKYPEEQLGIRGNQVNVYSSAIYIKILSVFIHSG